MADANKSSNTIDLALAKMKKTSNVFVELAKRVRGQDSKSSQQALKTVAAFFAEQRKARGEKVPEDVLRVLSE